MEVESVLYEMLLRLPELALELAKAESLDLDFVLKLDPRAEGAFCCCSEFATAGRDFNSREP